LDSDLSYRPTGKLHYESGKILLVDIASLPHQSIIKLHEMIMKAFKKHGDKRTMGYLSKARRWLRETIVIW